MEKKFRIAILASGSGSNAEEIMKYFQHHPTIHVSLLASNNPNAYALDRAKKYGVKNKIFNRIEFRESTLVLEWFKEEGITHIVLAGFLWLIPDYIISGYPGKIINIHPALLPHYGGKGMYGMNVHEAVKLAGEKETGITIHLVDEQYDNGNILFQAKCGIDETCTAEDIANRVHVLEHAHYPKVIQEWIISEPQTHGSHR